MVCKTSIWYFDEKLLNQLVQVSLNIRQCYDHQFVEFIVKDLQFKIPRASIIMTTIILSWMLEMFLLRNILWFAHTCSSNASDMIRNELRGD